MKHRLGLIIVLLVVLFVLTPAKDHSIAATRLTNPDIESPETHNSGVSVGEMIPIPAGEFQMGCDEITSPTTCQASTLPLHTVYLDSYYIDRLEVTNAQYKECVSDAVCTPPHYDSSITRSSYYSNSLYAQYPVIHVDWDQANNYCTWAGKHLPSEAQWEKAARGANDTRIFPWVSQTADCTLANYVNEGSSCVGDTSQVGNYLSGASPYGVMDMAGNVLEWVADWYIPDYYSYSPSNNPTGPETGTYKVNRGGSWRNGWQNLRTFWRVAYFITPEHEGYETGFRCVSSTSGFLDLPFDYSGDHSNALLDVNEDGGIVNSWFDHDIPTSDVTFGNDKLVLHTGKLLNSLTSTIVKHDDYQCYAIPGVQYCYDDHNGYDFIPNDIYAKAAAKGKVVYAEKGKYGKQVVIYHGDHGNPYFTLYGHLSKIDVNKGQVVDQNRIIGTIGNTGTASTGTHLHFGVYEGSDSDGVWDESKHNPIDPNGYDPDDPTGTTSYPWLWIFDRLVRSSFQGSEGITFTDLTGKIDVVIPSDYFDGDVTLELFREPQIAGASASLSTVGYSFWLRLLQLVEGTQQQSQSRSSDSLAAPSDPIDLTVTYSDEAILHLDESYLVLYYWDEVDEEWLPLPSTVDTANNKITAQTTELGHFDLQAPLLCSGDEFTSDDDYYGAVPLSINSPPVNRLFDVIEDEDWFSFKGIASADYTFQTDNLADGVDTIIEIYDIDGLTQLSSDDNSGDGLASKIEWTAPASGIYYLRVSQNSGSSFGCEASYQVSVDGETLLFLPLTIRK